MNRAEKVNPAERALRVLLFLWRAVIIFVIIRGLVNPSQVRGTNELLLGVCLLIGELIYVNEKPLRVVVRINPGETEGNAEVKK